MKPSVIGIATLRGLAGAVLGFIAMTAVAWSFRLLTEAEPSAHVRSVTGFWQWAGLMGGAGFGATWPLWKR